ncbi:MAG: DUF6174 domain-containing protein, partial [Aureibaculum sp.]
MKKFLILVVTLLVFISCSSEEGFTSELNTNRQLWESSHIENYKWSESLNCECGGPLLRDIFVVNNIKDRVEFDESLLFEGLTSEYIFNTSRTVEEAFDFIASLLNQNVSSLNIEYDAAYGFPILISIDYDV